MSNWYVYIVRCSDDSLYTGITKDPERRVDEHNYNNLLGALYTRGRRPVKLVYKEVHNTHSEVAKREYAIKQMSKKEKEALLAEQRGISD
ncbi:MAG: GIY-YIG nuclease family protein [Gammaproteobacteria bacterium]